jgi:hypothetical protein
VLSVREWVRTEEGVCKLRKMEPDEEQKVKAVGREEAEEVVKGRLVGNG